MQNYQGIENSTPANFTGGPRFGTTSDDELGRIGVVGGVDAASVATPAVQWKRNQKNQQQDQQQQQRQRRKLEKRDSIGSYDGNSSLNSLSIDELVGTLEGLDLDVVDNVNNNSSINNNHNSLSSSYNNDFLMMNDSSTTSRFSAGNWSIRDLEKWACSTCTYENEPVFCVCEMCGQAKPTALGVTSGGGEETALPSSTSIMDSSRSNLDSDSIRVQQEQRLTELLQYRPAKPAAATPATTTAAPATDTATATASSEPATVSKRAQLPPLSTAFVSSSRTSTARSISPRPPRSSRRSTGATNTRPLTMTGTGTEKGGELLTTSDLLAFPDITKPRRSFNPEDSAATATTFDMSGSNSGAFDWSFPSLQYPGIDEQQEEEECHNHAATTTAAQR